MKILKYYHASAPVQKDASLIQRRTKLPRLLIVMIAILAVLQVLVSNSLANTGMQLSEIESDIQTLNQENNDLRQSIASASAFTTIGVKAKNLGFVKKTNPVYLSEDLPVALDLH